MRFEVHVEDVEPALATSSENLADVPQEVRQRVAHAVSALAEALGGKSHLVRFAVSGQIGESERQADSVHVSVYRGAPIEVEESERDTLAGGDALTVASEDVAPVPQDVRSPE